MLILGIETSCDETGLALYDSDKGLIDQVLYSQVDLHADYGGVVPELASRDHVRKIAPLTRQLMERSHYKLSDLDGIAYTAGPGLMGALLVGASYARTLSWALGIPALAVHHMEAHLLAPLLDERKPPLPFIALLVSGGHTQLVLVRELGRYEMLGESVDDAAGEAFDKTAKLLDFDYPGGPPVAKAAQRAETRNKQLGVTSRFRFPRPMTDRPGLDFSFSGLKTFALNTVQQHSPMSDIDRDDIALAFEEAAVDTLVIKCRRAVEQAGAPHLVIAGGVSANQRLRQQLEAQLPAEVYYAPPQLCTDNGAMIAYAGALRLLAGSGDEHLAINTRARWPLDELPPISTP